MVCCAVGIGAASWAVAVVLAVVGTVNDQATHVVMPWLLIALAVGVTATMCVVVERSRGLVLDRIHAEFEGEVSERHLSAV